ncbi:MAG: ABC transporter, partial [Betaproteobacteria bacterium]
MNAPTERPRARQLRPLRALLPYLAPYRRQIALALLFLVLSATATLALPAAIRQLIDHGFAAEVADPAARMAAVRAQFGGIAAVALA